MKMTTKRSIAKRLWYSILHVVTWTVGLTCYHYRSHGHNQVPSRGGALVISNHQSHFDPVLVGLPLSRRLNYLARASLFSFAPFRWLINSLDAIAIDREGMGLSGLKETLKRLNRGEMVLLFPEGTRTRNGEVASLKRGFSALAKRAKVPLIPVGIDGAFQVWPRGQTLPRLGTIHVQYGTPITAEQFADLTEDELVALVSSRVEDCHAKARRSRRRAMDL